MDPFKRFSTDELFRNFLHRDRDVGPHQFADKRIYLLSDQDIEAPALANAKRLRSVAALSAEEIKDGIFYIYYLCDSDALPEVRRIHEHGGHYIPHLDFSKTSYRFVDRMAYEAISSTQDKIDRIVGYNMNVHENICEALSLVEHLEGDCIEFGVFLGGSALTTMHYLDRQMDRGRLKQPRTLWLLDTFDGFDYVEAKESADAIWDGTHGLFGVEMTMAHLKETFSHIKTPYRLVPSNICEGSLPAEITKIVFANIDVDMYEPTLAALQKISPHIVPGGIIICEDPASTPGLYGGLLAMEQFLATDEGARYVKIFKGGQYFLMRHRVS